MSGEQIVVRVGTDGQVRAETKGIMGPKCLESIQLLEDLLEAQATASAFTREYDEATSSASNPSSTVIEGDDELHQQ